MSSLLFIEVNGFAKFQISGVVLNIFVSWITTETLQESWTKPMALAAETFKWKILQESVSSKLWR